MGHEVDVLSAQDCNFKAVGDIKLVIDAGSISDHIKNGDYDGINIHGHTPTFSDRLLLKSKLAGKRVVYTLHCLADYCYFKPITTLYNSMFNNVALKLVDAVVVTSKSYYNMLHACSRKYIVPWGVDYNEFSGKRIPHDGYQLLFVGQMRPYKGMKVLFQAVKGIDAELSMVGDGHYRAEYEGYAHKLGLGNVHFYGVVSNDVLRRLYLSSDVLVLPSVGVNEAFGLVTLEAAAAGCAVVASDLPGVRDVVKEFGMLVKPNDSDSLKDALVTLKDKAVRKKYVSEGLGAVNKYSWRRVAGDYAEIYESVFL
jgi:glycosyltransferase involved in cell wall biosynthesis